MGELAAETGPPWRLADEVLRAREHERQQADEDLIAVYGDTFRQFGFTISRGFDTQEDRWDVAADRWVGIAQLPKVDAVRRQLVIDPKINADIFFLADYAYGRISDRDTSSLLPARVQAARTTPAAQLIAWFMSQLELFIFRHLRRDYIIRHEVLEGRIRGRLLLSEYISRHLATARQHQIPCQYFEFTQDNLPNQMLKRALRELRRLGALVPFPAARRELTDWADRLIPYLGTVSDVRITSADFNRLRLRGSLRHYQPIIEKVRTLLHGTHLTTELGAHSQDAFLWNMPRLFERALAGILSTTSGVVLLPTPARAKIVTPSGKQLTSTAVVPDFVVNTTKGRLILDAKYKQAVDPSTEDGTVEVALSETRHIRVSRADIYQVIAYARHHDYAPARTALVYPVALGVGQRLPEPHRVSGFLQDVSLLFLDVGPHAHHHVQLFRERLQEVIEEAGPDGAWDDLDPHLVAEAPVLD